MKTIEQFYNEIIANKALAEKLAGVSSEQQLDEFLKENEVDCDKEQFAEFIVKKAKESGQLSDDQLEAVSGGCGQLFGGICSLFEQLYNAIFG